MTFLKFKAVFTDEQNGIEEETIDYISINIDEISAFNPSEDENHTTVSLKSGQRYELMVSYDEMCKKMKSSVDVIVMHTEN